MRPFKFFFTLTIGVILLSFLFKVFFIAFIVAAVLSTIFYIGRKIGYFFRNLNWEERRHPYFDTYRTSYPNEEPSYRQEYSSWVERSGFPFEQQYRGERIIKIQ